MTDKSAAGTGNNRQSQLRLYLFDNPIIRLDFLRFRRRIANLFTRHGWQTLFFYVIVPVSISFFVSRWLFPPPYDKWSFVIMLKTMGTLTLALWGTAAVIYYIFDCAVFTVNPLGLKARDPLIDDPLLVSDYEKMLFVARSVKGIRIVPVMLFVCLIVIFGSFEGFANFGEFVGWVAPVVFLIVSSALGTMHLLAIFNLVFFYANSLLVRLVGSLGAIFLTIAPFIVGDARFGNEWRLLRYDVSLPVVSSVAWSFHPLGTAAAFLNGLPHTIQRGNNIFFEDVHPIFSMITIALQIFLVYFAWKLVRIRFRKMILENYLQKAKRG